MVLLVRALVHAKQTDRAVSFLQAILKSNPTNAEAYVLLGSIARTNGALDQAAKSFMTAIDKQPDNSIGYRAFAELYLRRTRPMQHWPPFAPVLSGNPTTPYCTWLSP